MTPCEFTNACWRDTRTTAGTPLVGGGIDLATAGEKAEVTRARGFGVGSEEEEEVLLMGEAEGTALGGALAAARGGIPEPEEEALEEILDEVREAAFVGVLEEGGGGGGPGGGGGGLPRGGGGGVILCFKGVVIVEVRPPPLSPGVTFEDDGETC